MIYKPVSAVTTEPVSLEQARMQIGLDSADTSSDILLTSLITAAREFVENYTNRVLQSADWYAYLDRFPVYEIELFKLPVTLVSKISYFNENNQEQTLSDMDYSVDVLGEPARIYPAYGKSWPGTYSKPNAVKITFTAGYPSGQMPKLIQAAMLMIITHLEANRGDEGFRTLPKTIKELLNDYRIERI